MLWLFLPLFLHHTSPALYLLYLMNINAYTQLRLSLQITKMCNGVCISIFIPQCSPLATHFNNTPSAKTYSTQTLKTSKSKLKRGEVSWQTIEQNAIQSYAAQGMKWLICDLGLSHKILWWRVRGRAWIVEKGRAWVSNRVCEKLWEQRKC